MASPKNFSNFNSSGFPTVASIVSGTNTNAVSSPKAAAVAINASNRLYENAVLKQQ